MVQKKNRLLPATEDVYHGNKTNILKDMTDIKNEEAGEKKSLNFIEQAVENDLKCRKNFV